MFGDKLKFVYNLTAVLPGAKFKCIVIIFMNQPYINAATKCEFALLNPVPEFQKYMGRHRSYKFRRAKAASAPIYNGRTTFSFRVTYCGTNEC